MVIACSNLFDIEQYRQVGNLDHYICVFEGMPHLFQASCQECECLDEPPRGDIRDILFNHDIRHILLTPVSKYVDMYRTAI